MNHNKKAMPSRLQATAVLQAILLLIMIIQSGFFSNQFNILEIWMDSLIFQISTLIFCWLVSPSLVRLLAGGDGSSDD